MNYIVTGNPRCGTSMMMRCLEKAGIRMAFKDVKKNEKETLINKVKSLNFINSVFQICCSTSESNILQPFSNS